MHFKGFSWGRRRPQGQPPQLPPPRRLETSDPSVHVPVGRWVLEVVSVLRADEKWLDGFEAMERIARNVTPGRYTGKEQASAFTDAHWQLLWPTFGAVSEMRIHFLGDEQVDRWGFVWVPCIRMNATGFTLQTTWLVSPTLRASSIVTQRDLLALRLA